MMFHKFQGALFQIGFYQSKNDNSLFVLRSSQGCTLLLLHADCMIIIGNDAFGIAALKKYLMTSFKMKDLDPLHYVLGLEIIVLPLVFVQVKEIC